MSVVSETADWLAEASHWSGGDGIPHRLLEHLGYTGLTVAWARGGTATRVVDRAHRTPAGVAVATTGALRALPTLGLLTSSCCSAGSAWWRRCSRFGPGDPTTAGRRVCRSRIGRSGDDRRRPGAGDDRVADPRQGGDPAGAADHRRRDPLGDAAGGGHGDGRGVRRPWWPRPLHHRRAGGAGLSADAVRRGPGGGAGTRSRRRLRRASRGSPDGGRPRPTTATGST